MNATGSPPPLNRDQRLAQVRQRGCQLRRRRRLLSWGAPLILVCALASAALGATSHSRPAVVATSPADSSSSTTSSADSSSPAADTPTTTGTAPAPSAAALACMAPLKTDYGTTTEYLGLTEQAAQHLATTKGDKIGVRGSDGACPTIPPIIADIEAHRVTLYLEGGVVDIAYRG